MSRLADIYKSQKKSGGGILSSVGKLALEKVDPRQLFNQSGLLAAMAPSLFKKYSATSMAKDKIVSSPTPQPSLSDAKLDLVIKQNQDIITNTKISAKNSLMFPGMARDMNVMRQNMVKMVKLQGGTAATKADMFFKTAKEREAEYEVKFQKDRPISPTPTEGKDKSGGRSGVLGMLAGFLPAIVSGIAALGSKVISGIAGAITGLGSLILQGITAALSIPNLMKAFGVVTEALGSVLKLATMVATNPLFLAMAAITGVSALLAFLRGDYDKEKARYMDLATKKKEQGSLSEEEQKELQRLERPNYREESIRTLGFDPTTGKEADKNITKEQLNIKKQAETQRVLQPGTAKEYLQAGEDFYKSEGYTRPQLEIMAAGKKVDLSQPSGVTPVQAPVAPSSPAPYNAARDSQAASAAAVSATTPNESAAETQRLMSKKPVQVPSSTKVTEEVSQNLVDFVKKKEGFSPKAFWDHKQWSIGYGTKSFEGEVIDEQEADKRLRAVLQQSQDSVLAHAKKHNYDFNQNQVDALSSFAYNLGPNILPQLTSNGSRSVEEIAAKIPEYNKASGKVLTGLQSRRAEEYAMFSSPGSTTGPNLERATITAAAPSMATLVAAAPTRPSSVISDSTVALSKVKEERSSAPIIVNAPTTNNNVQNGGGIQRAGTTPSIIDSELMKLLVERVAA